LLLFVINFKFNLTTNVTALINYRRKLPSKPENPVNIKIG